MIMEEKELAKAIINYFELYSKCNQDSQEVLTDKFNQLKTNIKEGRINLDATHQQLVDELGTHISYINQIGDKEYNEIYENIKTNYGVGKEEIKYYGNTLINTNDESTAFNKLLSVIPSDEIAKELFVEVNEKSVKKF